MSIFNPRTWFSQPETKESQVGSLISSWHVGRPVWTPRNYEAMAKESFLTNSTAYRCVKLLSQSATGIPWLLKRTGKKGALIEEHPLLDLLNRPNPMNGGDAMFEAFYAYLLLSGNSYLEAVGPKRKDAPPRELWAHRPDRMMVIPGPRGIPSGYRYEVDGTPYTWFADPITGQSDILHHREFHPLNDWYGMGRLEAAAWAVDRHNAASEHNAALLQNGARPSGALIFEPVTPTGGSPQYAPQDVLEAAKKKLEAEHGGPKEAGRPLVMAGNIKWQEMGMTPRDMDFGGSKDDAALDICNAFGVSHVLLMADAAIYNNMKEAQLQLYESNVIPLAETATSELNNWLTPRFGDGIELVLDLDAVTALEPRRSERRMSVTELMDKGVIDADEAREEMGFGARPENSVIKFDPASIKILNETSDTVGTTPLIRYMRSAHLFPLKMTDDEILASAIDLVDEDDDSGNVVDLNNGDAEDEQGDGKITKLPRR